MLAIMREINKKTIYVLLGVSIILFVIGIYEMITYDGLGRNCSGNMFSDYRDSKETEEILLMIKQECSSYKKFFTVWKYITFASTAIFIACCWSLLKSLIVKNR